MTTRNTHDLDGNHDGRLTTARMTTLAGALTVQARLESQHARLVILETQGNHRKRFTIDADISA